MPQSVPQPGSGPPPAPKVREELARILSIPDFAGYPRSSAFLTYVVEGALAGRSAEIKESTIGVDVFGRAPGYDSKSDSIVRTQARRVREKLTQYYLAEGRDNPVRIEIPKGGYVPEFRIVAAEPQPAPAGARPIPFRRIAAIATLAIVVSAGALLSRTERRVVAIHPPAIAVLPFADLDSGHRFASLSNGITEDLERDLSRVHDLRIHARPPAGQMTAQERADYATLSRRLAVDALLDGEIVPSGGGSEIRASLIRAADNSILWTDHFPGDSAIGGVERQIETGVAGALGVTLPPPPRVENSQAHDLFFAARTLWTTRDPAKIREAIGLYEQALRIDPDYALAYMGIADAYALMAAHAQIDPKTGIERGERAARKALELDPSLAEAHAALGLLIGEQWKWKEADAEYQRAIALNPSYDRAYVRSGTLRFALGDFPAAERLMLEAERLNPYTMSLPLIRAELYYYWRRYDDSKDLIREVQKAEPQNPTAFQVLARDFLAQHQAQRALEAARSMVAAEPGQIEYQSELVPCLRAAGNLAEAAQVLDRVLRASGPDTVDSYALALMYARMGDAENTLRHLEEALAQRVPDLPSSRWDPALDLVRRDPRFQAIVARIFPRGKAIARAVSREGS